MSTIEHRFHRNQIKRCYNLSMIKTNWHTHTNRCGHAVGKDEDYVRSAIQAGLTTLGFSDHCAYHKSSPDIRMNMDQVEDYITSIRSLQKKYEKDITLYLGMEVECYQSQWETLSQYRKSLDYCILGQHRINWDEESSYDIHTGNALMRYVSQIQYACEHSLCDCIAHPDVCMWSYPVLDETVRTAAHAIAEIAKKYNIPLEINCGSGVRFGKEMYQDGPRYAYPVRIFFEEAAKVGSRVMIGLDIHDPKLFLTDTYLNRALEVVEGLPLHIEEDINLAEEAKERKLYFF